MKQKGAAVVRHIDNPINAKIIIPLMSMCKKHMGLLIAGTSVILNVVLFGFKFWVGEISNSVSLVADAWHTLSDSFTSIIVIFGFWMASRPEDEKHPFGHGRAESVGAVVVGTLLGVVSVGFFRQAILRLTHYEAANFGLPAIIVTAVCIIVKEGMAQVSIRAGRGANSQSLVADGWHHRSDAITSVIILAGIFMGKYLWWIDGAMGIVVSAFILYAAVGIVREAASTLLGESPKKEFEDRIRKIICDAAPEACKAHHLHMHHYGDHTEVTVHLCLPPRMTVRRAHIIAKGAEVALKEKMGIDATIHMDPDDN